MSALLALPLTEPVTLRDLSAYVDACTAAGLPLSTPVTHDNDALTVPVGVTRSRLDLEHPPARPRALRTHARARRGAGR